MQGKTIKINDGLTLFKVDYDVTIHSYYNTFLYYIYLFICFLLLFFVRSFRFVLHFDLNSLV